MSAGGRALKVGLALFLVAIVAVAIVAALAIKPWARKYAVKQAHEHGVELEFEDLTLGLGHVRIHNSRFSLVGVPEIHGTIREMDVTLSGLKPVGISSDGMTIEAEGSAPMLVLSVTTWSNAYPHTFKLPAQATDVNVTWRQTKGGEPWIQLMGGSIQRASSGTSFNANRAVLGVCPETDQGQKKCPDLGKIGAAWSADDATVALGFGVDDVTQAPVKINVRYSLAKPVADIQLAPTDLERLAGPFGVKLPVKNVVASANVHLELPKGSERGLITGTLSSQLKGFVPPHPKELDGFVFGDVTTLDAKLAVTELRERADLTDVKVTAGAFKLGGSGSIEREEDYGRIKMELKGNLPCNALAGAAADSYLGKTLGGIAGQIAQKLVGGSVGITVKLDARSDDLPKAKVDRLIGIGCGLKPLKLDLDPSKFPQIPIPDLTQIPSGFPPPPIDIKIEPAPKSSK